jgi:hypothetical protein
MVTWQLCYRTELRYSLASSSTGHVEVMLSNEALQPLSLVKTGLLIRRPPVSANDPSSPPSLQRLGVAKWFGLIGGRHWRP